MEINITKFYLESCPKDYSASVAEVGANAGRDTWEAAKEDAEFFQFLDTAEKQIAFKKFVLDSGGWDQSEIDAWSIRELNALFLQWVAGDIRECLEWDVDDVWANYQEMAEAGQVPSSLFKTDDGQVYFYIGS